MAYVHEVFFPTNPLDKYRSLVGKVYFEQICDDITDFAAKAGNRTIWHINSTATGGGVAEMLQTMLGYGQSAGLRWRWLVIGGEEEFFAITKRIHNGLHGSSGDGGLLGPVEHDHYMDIINRNLTELSLLIQPGDYVILHDPQTAGLVGGLTKLGAKVVWRCHIGCNDFANTYVDRSWAFLYPCLKDCPAYIFTREEYVPDWVPGNQVHIVHPSIDSFSPKNQELTTCMCENILTYVGLLAGKTPETPLVYTQRNGQPGVVGRKANIVQTKPVDKDTPLMVQISRWDRLKDMRGVMQGFTAYVVDRTNAHLVLAGPDVSGVTDDPEGLAVYKECEEFWRNLPPKHREKIHLLSLPMDDVDENGAMVNSLQRHARIIIQKSLYEGFGLTITEAMWKRRPVVASEIGGIQDQIMHGKNGLLVYNPTDLKEFTNNLKCLLEFPDLGIKLGDAAHETVKQMFLIPRHIHQYVKILNSI